MSSYIVFETTKIKVKAVAIDDYGGRLAIIQDGILILVKNAAIVIAEVVIAEVVIAIAVVVAVVAFYRSLTYAYVYFIGKVAELIVVANIVLSSVDIIGENPIINKLPLLRLPLAFIRFVSAGYRYSRRVVIVGFNQYVRKVFFIKVVLVGNIFIVSIAEGVKLSSKAYVTGIGTQLTGVGSAYRVTTIYTVASILRRYSELESVLLAQLAFDRSNKRVVFELRKAREQFGIYKFSKVITLKISYGFRPYSIYRRKMYITREGLYSQDL